MQQTSSVWDQIWQSGDFEYDIKVVINGVDYFEDMLYSVRTKRNVFAENTPTVGCAVSGEIDLMMIKPDAEIPRNAMVRPYVRLKQHGNGTTSAIVGISVAGIAVVGTTGSEDITSEWLPKGVFYIDTRETNDEDDTLTIHGYDAMLFAEADFPSMNVAWPAKDKTVVQGIAAKLGVQIDGRTWEIINTASGKYNVQLPTAYSMREVLKYIASMYCGNFIMTDDGKLILIGYPLKVESFYLVNEEDKYITFGNTRIIIGGVEDA